MHRTALVAAVMLGFAAQDSWAEVVLFQRPTDTIQLSSPTTLGAAATLEARILYTPAYNGGQDLYREWVDSVEDKHLVVRPSEIAVELHDVGPTLSTPTTIGLNAWHHVAAVYDGASLSLYLDGVRVATRSASGSIANGSSLPIFGGGRFEGYWPVAGFVGYVDWFRMSNVARYSGTSYAPPMSQPPSDSNTVLLFYFDEAPGSARATDQSSYHNNGTLGVGASGATSPVFASDPLAPLGRTLVFNPAGVGHILYVPYYSTQSANVTAMNIVNTDTVHGKVVKVRFRGASNSDDVYDFQVFLSPGDVWTAGVSQAADGVAQLTTTDRSCTLPSSVNGKFIVGRTYASAPDRHAETREGYIEILTMADIVQGAANTNKRALYDATKHSSAGVPTCGSTLTALTYENAADYMEVPTTGLMANWAIVNVSKHLVYSGDAAAIEARDLQGDPAYGRLVYWDQRSTPLTAGEITTNTADPLFTGGYVAAARYDLPDLSTPYLPGATSTPAQQALELSDSIATRTVAGEFFNLASLGASTDWVVSFPTRRYHAAVRYTGGGAPAAVYGATNPYFTSSNTVIGASPRSYQLCSRLGLNALGFFDREERSPTTDDIVISPGTPTELSLCGEVAVLGINGGLDMAGIAASATFGALTRSNASNGFTEGWGYFTTPSAEGLPMLINQFTRYSNTTTNVYYGTKYPARVLEKGLMAP